jgi:hypothetical protein
MKGTIMNNPFDELAKAMAQPVGRRAALKTFGIGLGALALAALGLSSKAEAAQGGNGNGHPGYGEPCRINKKTGRLECAKGLVCSNHGLGYRCY